MNRLTQSVARPIMRLARSEKSVAAAEFALMAPVFALCVLVMLDIGLAINKRMYLDRVVRAGGQLAMTGVEDIPTLEAAVVNASAGADENNAPPSMETVDYTLSITRSCECGGAAGACNVRCTGGEPPSLFFNFDAKKMMTPIMLPELEVESKLRVQIR